jgi:hypothetical protein
MNLYMHTVTCVSDYRWGFGLMTGLIGLFDTAPDYNIQFTITNTLVSTVTSSLAVAW